MAKDEESKAVAFTSELKVARIVGKSYWGCTLGDLRKLVAAAEGIPDDAEVEVEKLQKHYVRVDTWLAGAITVRSEKTAEEADRG